MPAKDGIQEIYCNFAHANWTLFDLTIQIGQLMPEREPTTPGFVVEHRAAITFPWPQAKVLRDLLVQLVASYETANGEIKPINLPPDPTAKPSAG